MLIRLLIFSVFLTVCSIAVAVGERPARQRLPLLPPRHPLHRKCSVIASTFLYYGADLTHLFPTAWSIFARDEEFKSLLISPPSVTV